MYNSHDQSSSNNEYSDTESEEANNTINQNVKQMRKKPIVKQSHNNDTVNNRKHLYEYSDTDGSEEEQHITAKQNVVKTINKKPKQIVKKSYANNADAMNNPARNKIKKTSRVKPRICNRYDTPTSRPPPPTQPQSQSKSNSKPQEQGEETDRYTSTNPNPARNKIKKTSRAKPPVNNRYDTDTPTSRPPPPTQPQSQSNSKPQERDEETVGNNCNYNRQNSDTQVSLFTLRMLNRPFNPWDPKNKRHPFMSSVVNKPCGWTDKDGVVRAELEDPKPNRCQRNVRGGRQAIGMRGGYGDKRQNRNYNYQRQRGTQHNNYNNSNNRY